MNKFLIYTFFTAALISCIENTSKSVAEKSFEIKELLVGDFANDTIFTIDLSVENVLETRNGSSIVIPANALVNAEGNAINGLVEVSFKQFHSMEDILASGIPMTYDTLETDFTFESAGMFQIEATANEKPAFLRENEKIDVNLASDKDEKFNFYELDQATGKWQPEVTPVEVIENAKFNEADWPKMPEIVREDAFVLDVNLDLSDYSELSHFNGIVWEYTGDNDSLDPRKQPQIKQNRWTDIDLDPTHKRAFEYYLTFKNAKTSFTTQVKAGLNEADFEMAMANFEAQQLVTKQNRDNLQKPFVRSVSISGFGTYNHDYIYKIENPVNLMADFDFGKHNYQKEQAMIVVIYEDSDVIINFPPETWSRFSFDGDARPKIVAVLPDNKVAVYTKDVSASFGKSKMTFKMNVFPDPIDNKNDLVALVHNL